MPDNAAVPVDEAPTVSRERPSIVDRMEVSEGIYSIATWS
jgi:hypothetical protein